MSVHSDLAPTFVNGNFTLREKLIVMGFRGETPDTQPALLSYKEEKNKKNLLRAGFEPATYGCLSFLANYSPPLYQLSYRR